MSMKMRSFYLPEYQIEFLEQMAKNRGTISDLIRSAIDALIIKTNRSLKVSVSPSKKGGRNEKTD